MDIARTIKEGEMRWTDGKYDLLVLDVSLPDGSGFDFCKKVRLTSNVPVIFLTASDEETSIIMGLDIGGDDDGAVALGQYFNYLKDEDFDMFFVLNLLRPLTQSTDDIAELASNIELMSRLRLTSLIDNTNLSYLTEPVHVADSIARAEEIAERLGIPLSYIAGTKENLRDVPQEYKDKTFPMELFMKLPFDI